MPRGSAEPKEPHDHGSKEGRGQPSGSKPAPAQESCGALRVCFADPRRYAVLTIIDCNRFCRVRPRGWTVDRCRLAGSRLRPPGGRFLRRQLAGVAAFGRSAGDGGARRGGSRLKRRRWSRTFSERTCHRGCGHSPLTHAADRHQRYEKEQSSSSNSHRLLPSSLGANVPRRGLFVPVRRVA